MTRILGHHLSVEMLLLWLIESAIAFVLLYWLLAGGVGLTEPAGDAARVTAALLVLSFGAIAFAVGLYRPETCLETRRLLVKAVVAGAASLPAIWMVGKVTHHDLGGLFGWDPAWPMQMLVAWVALLLATRLLVALALRSGLFTRRLALLGAEADITRTAEALAMGRRGQFRVAARIAADATDAAPSGLWGVVLSGRSGVALAPTALESWRRRGLQVLPEASFWERHLGRIDLDAAAASGAVAAARPHRVADAVHRGMDVAFATLLLLLTAPLMLLTALLIRLDSPGPTLYRQERVGLGGKPFTVLKFRSMRTDAERHGPVWASTGDARVTRVGGFIRRVRIDELPQLFNILRGEMSLIGPRPERPHFVAQLATALPLYHQRAQVKPGLTGWAQVNFPYGASVEDARIKLSYDLYYVKYRSVFLDLLILFATVRVVLFQEGSR